ncbi:DUF2510 domain-containing protein [Demequina sediminicola]|uniref:DUF2510 domain-containing protein n=1 Tax=Demequina sediminicola TaxID=1095026 RepID=UPI0007807EDD|nr:DUF2510 domain-containing protein [Demequina sediminicola]
MTHAPAGWFDDGSGTGRQRYWDGQQWTEHFHPALDATASPEGVAAGTDQAEAAQTHASAESVHVASGTEGDGQPHPDGEASHSASLPTWAWGVIGGGALLIVGIVVAAFVVVLGDDDPAADAQAAMEDYVEAIVSADCAALNSLTTEAFQDDMFESQTCEDYLVSYEEDFGESLTDYFEGTTFTVTDVVVEGDTAVVFSDSVVDGEEAENEDVLVLVDGEWLVDVDQA